jgi:voltage-gated potassium channel
MTTMATVRQRVHAALHRPAESGLTWTQRGLVVAILGSLVVTILGTESTLVAEAPRAFAVAELAFGVVFLVEYVLRVWSAGEDPRFTGLRGRWRYARTPFALVDFIAVVPFLVGLVGAESMALRIVRLARLVVLAKAARYSAAMRLLAQVIAERRFELGFTVLAAMVVVVVAATALYVVEGANQPDTFGSIPRAMWWAVATLTTVGYGDVYPVTPLGRVLGAITAFAGIGLIAMPTGILAAALSDALARARDAHRCTPGLREDPMTGRAPES